MKTITFIGGSGFFGKSYIDAFNRGVLKKFKIKKINLISRNIKKLKKTKIILDNIELIAADVSKLKKLPKSDLIIYAADKANLKNVKNVKKFISSSKKSIDNFCEIAKLQKKAKILYISSGAVYRLKKDNLKNINLITKKQLYAFNKVYSENKIKSLRHFKIKTSIARCFTFVGPWLPRKSNFAIGNFIDNVLNQKKIHVKANSKVFRSYMYSDDLVYWLTKICINAKIDTLILNVGSDKSIEIRSLAKLFARLFKVKIKFNKLKGKKIDKYIPNIKESKIKLGLKIKYNLKDSIILTINKIHEKNN